MLIGQKIRPSGKNGRRIAAILMFIALFQFVSSFVNNACFAAPQSSPAKDRFWIFYGDSAAFNPTARIDTCAGEKVPVVIRASADETTISTERSTPFTITLSSGIIAFADSTTPAPITVASLVNGTVTIWITASGRNVINGSITITSTDSSVTSGTRDKINFKSCFSTPLRGAFFATNGRGAVDMAKVYYYRALTKTEVPDSIALYWPGTTGQKRVAKKQDIVQDTTDKRVLNITLPQSFSYGITRYTQSGAMLGCAYWANPLIIDIKATLEFPFDIADSVGPILTSATLIERLVTGNDSLILTFSETVSLESMRENGLTLLKKQEDGSFLSTPLQILKTDSSNDGAILTVINTTGETTLLKDGDSLRITSGGPIVDMSGNKAHPLNRPVVLTTKKGAPDIVSARYEDRNADGRIETVQIGFNKAVAPDEMGMQFKWENEMSEKADSTRFSVVNQTTVDVNIDGMFSESFVKNKTSGVFNVTIVFTNYTVNNKKNLMATDGAAPVLTSLRYCQGFDYYDPSRSFTDTVDATFSESLKNQPVSSIPFTFRTSAGEQFNISMHYSFRNQNMYRFLVDSATCYSKHIPYKTDTPFDSAWIHINVVSSALVTDNASNSQNNPANKRVPVTINFRRDVRIEPPTTQTDDPPQKSCGCGSGTGLALIPPLFFYSRQKLKNRKKR